MRSRGVSWFSITDHDTTRAYAAALDAPGQHVVTGIEINTTWQGSDVHILGYNIPTGTSPLGDVIETGGTAAPGRHHGRGLNPAGYPVTVEQVLSESGAATRWGGRT